MHIGEASCSAILWAAVVDFTDLGDIIEITVVLGVELLITDRVGIRVARAAWRDLVINVQVLGAALLSSTVNSSTTVTGEHLCTIGITFVVAISQVVLVMMATVVVTRNPCCLGGRSIRIRHFWCIALERHRMNVRPLSLMVNLKADGVAVLVILLPGNIDAGLRSTLGQKFFLGVLVQENVNIALNFLGCRPINLAVLLKTFGVLHAIFIALPAGCLTLLKFDTARAFCTRNLLALASFEFLLLCITGHVDTEEMVVALLARSMELLPFCVQTCVVSNHSTQPRTILALAGADSGNTLRVIAALGVADRKIWAEAIFNRAHRWLLRIGEAMEGTTALCHGNV